MKSAEAVSEWEETSSTTVEALRGYGSVEFLVRTGEGGVRVEEGERGVEA